MRKRSDGVSATLRPKIGTTAREWNTDIVCGEGAFVRRETSCPKGTCESEGDCDGRFVRDTERVKCVPKY